MADYSFKTITFSKDGNTYKLRGITSAEEAKIQSALTASDIGSEKGVANGLASLDASGKVPSSQLPSYVDDVLEYSSFSNFPVTGESGKIYLAIDTNYTYRWNSGTSTYVLIGSGTSEVAISEHDVDILTTDWESASSGYAYTWSNSSINTHTFFDIYYRNGIRNVSLVDFNATKVSGGIQFTISEIPSATLPLTVRLYDADFVDPGLPVVSSTDNGKVLMVVNGAWAAETVADASGVSF